MLLQPSMKPFDQGTSIEFRISWNQLRYALVQSVKFRRIHDFNGCEPVNEFWFSGFRGIGVYYFEELIFQTVRIRKSGCYFKHEG